MNVPTRLFAANTNGVMTDLRRLVSASIAVTIKNRKLFGMWQKKINHRKRAARTTVWQWETGRRRPSQQTIMADEEPWFRSDAANCFVPEMSIAVER
jgi:hypothetical protein